MFSNEQAQSCTWQDYYSEKKKNSKVKWQQLT